jgi:hypothetical protein
MRNPTIKVAQKTTDLKSLIVTFANRTVRGSKTIYRINHTDFGRLGLIENLKGIRGIGRTSFPAIFTSRSVLICIQPDESIRELFPKISNGQMLRLVD